MQWDVSTGGSFSPLSNGGVYSGVTTTMLIISAATADLNGYQYEAVFSNTAGTLTSSAAALTVDYIPTTGQPVNQTVNAGQGATFAAASSNPDGTDTVQWQMSTGGGFSPLSNDGVYSGVTTTMLTISGATADLNGCQYEAVFSNTAGAPTTTAAILTVNSATTVATVATWNSAGDATWNSAGNWIDSQGTGVPGFSGVTGDQATFNGAAGLNVNIGNFSPSIAGLTFGSNGVNYDIASSGSGVLHLNNRSSNATITVSAGSQTIAAPLALDSSVSIVAAAGSRLAISGPISGGGSSLTLGGGGTLVLSGANSYDGGTTVSAGTLILSNSSAIAANTSLTVGAGGTLIFDPSVTASHATTAASNTTTAAASDDTSITTAVPAATNAASATLVVLAFDACPKFACRGRWGKYGSVNRDRFEPASTRKAGRGRAGHALDPLACEQSGQCLATTPGRCRHAPDSRVEFGCCQRYGKLSFAGGEPRAYGPGRGFRGKPWSVRTASGFMGRFRAPVRGEG